MYRSTKGASKARRDQINAEIRNLKDLLPIAEGDKLRLSYLHIMSLACIYTRKSIFFSKGRSLAGGPRDPAVGQRWVRHLEELGGDPQLGLRMGANRVSLRGAETPLSAVLKQPTRP